MATREPDPAFQLDSEATSPRTKYGRKKSPAVALVVGGVIVGLLVAVAAGIYIFGKAQGQVEKEQYRIDKERLPKLQSEFDSISKKLNPPEVHDDPNDVLKGRVPPIKLAPGEDEGKLRQRLDELDREIAAIWKRHPDLARH